jgi:hypothetical protein
MTIGTTTAAMVTTPHSRNTFQRRRVVRVNEFFLNQTSEKRRIWFISR